MNRRGFIKFVGGAALSPLTARISRAADRVRRIGALLLLTDNEIGQSPFSQFQDRLQKLGWTVGRNALIDARLVHSQYRRGVTDPSRGGSLSQPISGYYHLLK